MADDVTFRFDQAALATLFTSTQGPIAKDLARRTIKVHRRVQQLVHQHGSGRIYTRGNITHQASAPGEPPAADTGKYAATIGFAIERDGLGLVGKVGTGDKRGPWLELGTARMAARPHLRPGLEAAK